MWARSLLLGAALAFVTTPTIRAQVLHRPAGSSDAGRAAATQPPRDTPPVRTLDATLARWVEVQAGTFGLVGRQIDNGSGTHTLSALQWSPTLRGRVRFDRDARYTLNVGIQGGRNFKLSWNGSGVGSQDFFADFPTRHLYLAAAPVTGFAVQAGSMPLMRGESSEITTWDTDGYVLGERIVVARRSALWFDEVSFTNAFLGDWARPSVFHRTSGWGRNYRQLLASRRVNGKASLSADYTAHAGTHTLRQGLALRTPRLFFDLVRLEQYARVAPDTHYGVGVSVEKVVTRRLRLGGGFASVDTHFSTWNGDKYNVGDHVFASVTTPLLDYLALTGFYGRELHAPVASANLNRIDVQVTYDALAHWRASRKR